jgi:hypothetical protein
MNKESAIKPWLQLGPLLTLSLGPYAYAMKDR